VCSAEEAPNTTSEKTRPDILFEDFEADTYGAWTVEGNAFGDGPMKVSEMGDYYKLSGVEGDRLVNTHDNRTAGEQSGDSDRLTGKLTSPEFKIERRHICFLIVGGPHAGQTCVNLLIDGEAVRTAVSRSTTTMHLVCWDVSDIEGSKARLEVVDSHTEGWGHIGIDHIVFTDVNRNDEKVEDIPGFGTMALTLIGDGDAKLDTAGLPELPESAFGGHSSGTNDASRAFGEQLVGSVGTEFELAAGEEKTVTFLVAWHFPDYHIEPGSEMAAITGFETLKRQYAARFPSALEVSTYVAKNLERLAGETRNWRDTWYDSTLPYWFLDRTFVTMDCLATETMHQFDNGRYWGWEGVACCPGTCQHVWNYAQGMARIFPSIERYLRRDIDYGISWNESGATDYRGESSRMVFTDGQLGTVIRVYREHQASADDEFLRGLWPRVKKSIEFMIGQDGGEDGILEGRQYNTLDAAWYGPMAWISSMYVCALLAGAEMADEMGDAAFAKRCRTIAGRGSKLLVSDLYDGEYFIHKSDPEHPEATNTNDGCHIDQIFGQSFAWQVGLGRFLPRSETLSALEALWRYNYAPDIGPYRESMKPIIDTGRWYAMPGEGGLLMCTWPKGGADQAPGEGNKTFVGYFNECMTGFEYQVASHMIWEGMTEEGLAIIRTIHDRYHASKRNPYNEIECSDHYSRAMASYGAFLAACGYEYHGPKGHLGFAPRITPENFRAPFTAAEGWGTYSQKRSEGSFDAEIALASGSLRLSSLSFEAPDGVRFKRGSCTAAGKRAISLAQEGSRVTVSFDAETTLAAGESLKVELAS
jgi:hypothetical protein